MEECKMIGKPEWFSRRKYTGWGFNPVTWQGWAYICLIALPPFAFNTLYNGPAEIRIGAMVVWAVIFIVDAIDIMAKLKKDEREEAHEAIAERNAAWVMVLVLAIGIAYQAASSIASGTLLVDPFILAAIALALIAKGATNIYLDRKD